MALPVFLELTHLHLGPPERDIAHRVLVNTSQIALIEAGSECTIIHIATRELLEVRVKESMVSIIDAVGGRLIARPLSSQPSPTWPPKA